jgi:hypothetical protein
MPGKNERQGRYANIFFFHEGSLQGRAVQWEGMIISVNVKHRS